jgi:hypothetical protein
MFTTIWGVRVSKTLVPAEYVSTDHTLPMLHCFGHVDNVEF